MGTRIVGETLRGVMPAGIMLLVVSAALHAGWNALLKREENKLGATIAVLAVADVTAFAFSILAGGPMLDAPATAWAVVAGLSEAGYFIALAYALSQASYGLAYAVSRGGAMLLVWAASAVLLHERVDAGTYAGVALLFGGMLLVNLARRSGEAGALRTPDRLAPSYVAAGFIAAYHLAYGQSLAHGATPSSLFAIALLVALPVVAGLMGREPCRDAWRALTRRTLWIALCGMLATASFIIFLAGLARTGAGVAITVRNTSIVFAQVFALMLGERVSRRQALGATLIMAGAALVGLPR